MDLHWSPRAFNGSIRLTIACLVTCASGCVSSRTLYEGLAKTPHIPIQGTASYGSLNAFQQDFLYLAETVRETHPEPYTAWSKAEFDREEHRVLVSLAAETSKVAFEKSLQSFLSRLSDTHTNAQTAWMGGELQYPVSFFWIKDTLILASVARVEDTTLIGSHVLSFNGHSVDDVFTRFARYIAYSNVYDARRILQYSFVFPTLHRDAGIIDSDTLEMALLDRDGMLRTHRVVPVRQPKRVAPYKTHPVTGRVSQPFTYTLLADQHACYFQWNTMTDLRAVRLLSFPMNILGYPVLWVRGIGYFDNFLEDMFEEMKHNNVTTLIVDLRGNGGGSSNYAQQLLYHLDVPSNIRDYSMAIKFSPLYREFFREAYAAYAAAYAGKHAGKRMPDDLLVTSDFMPADTSGESFFRGITDTESDDYIPPDRTVFKGNVYVLVGEATYSSAIILASIVKDNRLFTTVGQPTRGRPSHDGEMLAIRLPNSGMICTISCKKFFRPDLSKDSEDSLYPDVTIWPTFEDRKEGLDPVLDWVLRDAHMRSNP